MVEVVYWNEAVRQSAIDINDTSHYSMCVSRETFASHWARQRLKIPLSLLILLEENMPSALLEKEDNMIRFNNDYNQTCVPEILAAIQNLGDQTFPGYGQDDLCNAAVTLLREEIGWEDADIHFMPGATQANFIVHAAALRPIESVICATAVILPVMKLVRLKIPAISFWWCHAVTIVVSSTPTMCVLWQNSTRPWANRNI